MAIWQFKLELIPQCWLDSGGDLASLFGADGCDPSPAWIGYDARKFLERLNLLLPRGHSWYDECLCWGSDKTDDIELWSANGKICSLSVRFDLRSLNRTLLESVIQFARDFELALLLPSARRVFAGDTDSLATCAMQSEAARFVRNPREFLAKLDEIPNAVR